MSLLRGDDLKTNFIQASSIVGNVIVGAQFQDTSPVTAYLNAQPCTFNSLNGSFTTLNVEGAQGVPGQTLAFHTSSSSATVVPGNSVITETGTGDGAGGMLLYTGSRWTLVANSGNGGSGSSGPVVVTGAGVPDNTVITSSLIVSGPISGVSLSAATITCGTIAAGTINLSSFQAADITGTSSIVGGAITGSSVNALTISSATITCGVLTAGTISLGGSLQATAITGSTVVANVITGTSSIVSAGAITGSSLSAVNSLQAPVVTGTSSIASNGAITGSTVAAQNSVRAQTITATSSIASNGTIVGVSVNAANSVQAQTITGTSSIVSAGAITGLTVAATNSVQALNITGTSSIASSGAITGSSVYALTISSSAITCGILSVGVISLGSFQAAAITGLSIAANVITGTSSIASAGAITGLTVNALTSVQALNITGTSSIASASAITGLTVAATNSVQAAAITGTASIASAGAITGSSVNATNGMQAPAITGTSSIVSVGAITGSSVNASASLRAAVITGTVSIAGGAITGSTVNASNSVQASAITGTTINASAIVGTTINGLTITGTTMYATTMNSASIFSNNMYTDVSQVKRYRPVTFNQKNDGIVTQIDAPTMEGEMYVGVNAGRSPYSYATQIPNSLGFSPYWVIEFQSNLFWGGGSDKIVQTNYTGLILNTIDITGGTGGNGYAYCCYVDAIFNRLYFGGDFTSVTIGGVTQTCNYIAYLDSTLTTVSPLISGSENGLNSTVYSIRDGSVIFGAGGILVGGAFTGTQTGAQTLARVAFGSFAGGGSSWSQYPIIDNGIVYDAITFNNGTDNVLVVGGSFTSYAGGNPCAYIIGWNLSSSGYITNIGGVTSAFDNVVKCFEVAAGFLYAGGLFTAINGASRKYCTYFATSDLTASLSFDFDTSPSSTISCETIYYEPTQGIVWRGGGHAFGLNTNVYSGSQLSNGLDIGYKNAFYFRAATSQTYFVNQAGGNGAYIYAAGSTATQWSLPANNPILNTTTGYTSVTALDKGSTFTLVGALGGISGAYWYAVAERNCTFS